MVGLPFLACPSYFLTSEANFLISTQTRYRAAEALIAELEQYKKKEGIYPFSTGKVPTGFASKEDCINYHIGYCTQGNTYTVYFSLASYLVTYHNYSYCPNWSQLPKESQRGKATEKPNWRVEIGID
jgi:hypothetical protein